MSPTVTFPTLKRPKIMPPNWCWVFSSDIFADGEKLESGAKPQGSECFVTHVREMKRFAKHQLCALFTGADRCIIHRGCVCEECWIDSHKEWWSMFLGKQVAWIPEIEVFLLSPVLSNWFTGYQKFNANLKGTSPPPPSSLSMPVAVVAFI